MSSHPYRQKAAGYAAEPEAAATAPYPVSNFEYTVNGQEATAHSPYPVADPVMHNQNHHNHHSHHQEDNDAMYTQSSGYNHTVTGYGDLSASTGHQAAHAGAIGDGFGDGYGDDASSRANDSSSSEYTTSTTNANVNLNVTQHTNGIPNSGSHSGLGLGPGSAFTGTGSGAGLMGPNFNHRPHPSNGSSSSGSHVSPIPEHHDYNQRSPPPVFSKAGGAGGVAGGLGASGITSPTSNNLSAASSLTNLNLNASPNHQQAQARNQGGGSGGAAQYLTSKSESNIDPIRYGHQRAVSSTSSFFNDKSDTVSMVDYNHNIIQQYLGSNSHRSVPRMKTMELYRQNAKKSNDPTVLFQYAQYTLQTALMMESNNGATTNSSGSGNNSPNGPLSTENSPRKGPNNTHRRSSSLTLDKLKHKKSSSNNSFGLSDDEGALGGAGGGHSNAVSDAKLKKELIREALHYLRKLSDKGYVDAQYLLADAHSSGALGKIENRYSFVLFQAAAKHGHVESAYRTSYCFEEGLGTGRDARKAVEYLKMAASKNHSAAMYKLGVYSFYGRMGLGSDVNTKKMGIKWLTRASNIASELTAAAPYELGKIYFTGFKDILIKDEKYALELYSQAAALGHIESAKILGQYYEIGEIVPQDSNLSIHYYTQAALGGDPEAMLAMCAWYLVGSEPFLPKDEMEAFEWAKRAAQANFVKAQYALGNFYEKGIGCEKNLQESQNWYKKAAEGGDEKSLTRILDKDWVNKHKKTRKYRKSISSDSKGKGNSAEEKECVIM